MSQISDFKNPWRDLLISEPATFRGVMFHVENGGRTSGRRTVSHEYPKRNLGYAEDMGRHARRFQFSAYLVYRPWKSSDGNPYLYDYVLRRKRLHEALEDNDAGMLTHPVFAPGGVLVMCERYTMTESRERGGYTAFEMQFVEAGKPTLAEGVSIDTLTNVASNAARVENIWTAAVGSMFAAVMKNAGS